MKLFRTNKNTLLLTFVILITIGFFVAGLFKILDYFMVKAFFFSCYGIVLVMAIRFGIKNNNQKNRLEDKPQDDSH